MEVKVTTYRRDADGQTLGIEQVKTIDYNNKSDRIWLKNHSFWALTNNRRIATEAVN